MSPKNNTWPAAAMVLLMLGAASKPSAAAFAPYSPATFSPASTLLKVAAEPRAPEGAAASSNDSYNFDQYKDLHEANMALNDIAVKCGNARQEPVIARADECQSQWEAMRGSVMEPDTVSFNTVLKAWSKCCQALADYKKHDFVTISNTGSGTSQDHPQVYTAKDAAERATLLLLSQEQDFENGSLEESARPDTLSYNEAITAWAKSGCAEAPTNAERLLKRMLDHEYINPDVISYNGVVDAWAYSGKPEAVQKVKQIWQHMEQLYADGDEGDENRIKPTIRTVNSIITAHAKRVQESVESRDIDGARKTARDAEEYLDLMKERYEQTQDPDHMPDVMTYTTVMDTYGRCGRYHSTLRAKALLDELKDVYRQHKNPKQKPNVRTYTSLITAWSKTRSPDSPQEAESLLKELLNSKDPELEPNSRTFTAVIHAWGRSADHTKAERALKLLQAMKAMEKEATSKSRKQEVKPTLVSYNAALDACARCQGDLQQQTDALKIAFAVLKAVQQDKSLEANSVTFATLLRACSFLLQPGDQRNHVGTMIFEKAQKAGMADYRVLLQLIKTVDSTVLPELLGELPQDRRGNFDFSQAPPGWSRNVR